MDSLPKPSRGLSDPKAYRRWSTHERRFGSMKTIRRMLMLTGVLSIFTAGLILVEPALLTYIAAIYLFIFGAENIRNAYAWKNLK